MISFTLPWALLGLVAAALPLLLHLVQKHEVPEVIFPAVRYLEDATRDQRRRLKLRQWLLLIVRTLLIVALVFAAAGATMRRTTFGPHAPSALVLVIDNSGGSGVVIDGEPLLDALMRAAGHVLDRATLSDRVWLIAADGVARAGTPAELRRHLAALRPEPVRLDLGRAVAAGRELIHGSKRPGEVVLVSPLQRSALGAARGDGDVLVVRPSGAPPSNRGILTLTAGLQPWSPAGGRITISIVSSDTAPVPVALSLGNRPLRDVLVTPGAPSIQRIGPQAPGWLVVTATLPPDEFRLDDSRSIAVRVAPPVAVEWDSTDRYIDAAARVLAADGRIRPGSGIRLGSLSAGPSVVMPPEDPARVGALNRSLAARGIGWHFGTAIAAAAQIDSGPLMPASEAVTKRYALEHDGAGDVLATVGGAPWLVRAGDALLLGSRLDPSWTALPLSASFVPFLDAMLTSTLQGTAVSHDGVAGEPIRLPDRTTAVAHDGVATSVTGGGEWTPRTPGVFHLLAGTDTLGTMSVRLDPRESDLSRATDRDVRALWRGATVAGLAEGPALAFAAGGRGDLRGALLLLALGCALAETLLTGRARARS
jgi:hypothetical protein